MKRCLLVGLLAASLLFSACYGNAPESAPESVPPSTSQEPESNPSEERIPEHEGVPRNHSSFITGEIYRMYTRTYRSQIRQGVDVSEFQGKIDWEKVKATGASFAMLRVGGRGYSSAVLYTDRLFAENLQGAIAAGLNVGLYFYSQATNVGEAIREADYLLRELGNAELTLPIFIDFEYYGNGEGRLFEADLSVQEATAVCEAFCETIESAGYTAGVYASATMLEEQLDATYLDERYAVWIAQYSRELQYEGFADFWQISAEGQIPGIAVATDANFRIIDQPECIQNVTCVQKNRDSLVLSWEKVSGSYSYQIQRRRGPEEEFATVAELIGAGNTQYRDSNLQSNSEYQYRVCAVVRDGEQSIYGDWSNLVTEKTAE